MEPMASLAVDVWVDLISPACFVAKRRLEAAVAASAHPAEVTITYRAFELDPEPPGGADTAAEQQARAHQVTAQAAMATLEELAITTRPDGIVIAPGALQPVRTRDAHRVLHAALSMGGPALQGAVLERLFVAYFTEGRAIDDTPTLLRLAAEAGVDERRLAAILASDEYSEEVLADERDAAERGITSVPFILAGDTVASAGLQEVEGFVQLLGLASSRM